VLFADEEFKLVGVKIYIPNRFCLLADGDPDIESDCIGLTESDTLLLCEVVKDILGLAEFRFDNVIVGSCEPIEETLGLAEFILDTVVNVDSEALCIRLDEINGELLADTVLLKDINADKLFIGVTDSLELSELCVVSDIFGELE